MSTTQYRTITRTFKTMDKAEKFQDQLYSKYNGVELLHAPMFSEEGAYAWRVSGPVDDPKPKAK